MRFGIALMGLMIVLMSCGNTGDRSKSLFEQGQKAEAAKQYSKALESYQAIVDSFPRSEYRYKAIFMAGYIQLEFLKNKEKAALTFSRLIDEYPNCDLADDAAIMREAAISGRDLMSIIEDSLKTK